MKLLEQWIQHPQSERQAHMDLSEECLHRGGNSTVHKGVLAQYLDTNIPVGNSRIHLCHSCNDGGCSNPRHLYWGTISENNKDGAAVRKRNGTPWVGYPHTEETKRKISLAKKGKKLKKRV